MQEELNKLQYGNCDVSDWEGRLNTNNSNPATIGFWIESSLAISPKEQVEVMERIFGENGDYSQETQNQLKQVMLVSDSDETAARIYFCVYLGGMDGENISSAIAKEIAFEIISDY